MKQQEMFEISPEQAVSQTATKTLIPGTPGYSNLHACSCTFLGYGPDGRLRVEFTPSEPESLLDQDAFEPDTPEPGDRINTDYSAYVALVNECNRLRDAVNDIAMLDPERATIQEAIEMATQAQA